MNPVDFCYWLQGHFELSDPKTLDEKQIEIIKNHLNLVFEFMNNPANEEDEIFNILNGNNNKDNDKDIHFRC